MSKREQDFINSFQNKYSNSQILDMTVVFRSGNGKSVLCRLFCCEVLPDGTGDGVLYCLKEVKDKVGIVLIRSMSMQKRYGTKFMNLLCEEADRAGVDLELDPYPQVKGLKVNKLKEWYKRFGFKSIKGMYLRKAKGDKMNKRMFKIIKENNEIVEINGQTEFMSVSKALKSLEEKLGKKLRKGIGHVGNTITIWDKDGATEYFISTI